MRAVDELYKLNLPSRCFKLLIDFDTSSSIARTNLEVDLVQRGGHLVVETRGASAIPSFSTQTSNTNKPKFCFGKNLLLSAACTCAWL